jgi:CRP/FNR family transcriptional regulator
MVRIAKINEGCAVCPARKLCGARDLDSEGLEQLSECVATSRPMNRGETLYRAGERSNGWYVVRSGVFRTTTITADGSEYVTGFHYPGELIGVEGSADDGHCETATALGSATACRIAAERIPELLALGAGSAILRLLAERDRAGQATQINLRQPRAEARVAGFLRDLMLRMERQGFDPRRILAPMSRTDMANHLGLTLECVSRVLGRWRRAGVIETSREHINVLDPSPLQDHAAHLAA